MDVVDIKKLETAIMYLQRITEGHNPVNNMPVDEDSIINNPNVVRCMSFIKDVLETLKQNDGYIGRKPRKSKGNKPALPLECLKDFEYNGDKSITKFVEQICGLYDVSEYARLTYEPITKWLKQNGYLYEKYDNEFGKKVTEPTDKGNKIGIKSERRKNSEGQGYIYITYNQKAQELIVQNMKHIISQE